MKTYDLSFITTMSVAAFWSLTTSSSSIIATGKVLLFRHQHRKPRSSRAEQRSFAWASPDAGAWLMQKWCVCPSGSARHRDGGGRKAPDTDPSNPAGGAARGVRVPAPLQ